MGKQRLVLSLALVTPRYSRRTAGIAPTGQRRTQTWHRSQIPSIPKSFRESNTGGPRVVRRAPDRADPPPPGLFLEPERELLRVGAARVRRERRWVVPLGVVDGPPGPEQAPGEGKERPPVA